jgi:hypothetical protein
MSAIVDPREVLARGLRFLNLDPKRKWNKECRVRCFKKHYGASPLSLATQWHDLCHTNIEKAKLTKKEKSRGIKMFLVSHFFLWNYTRNADQLGRRFGMCEKMARGLHLWDWIERVAALEERVIFWPKDLDLSETEVNAISIDGVDKRKWETKHASLSLNTKNCSQKHNHGALKYQITLAAHRQQCVHIFGPVRGGMGDKEMLSSSEILKRLKKGKLANTDRGYIDQKKFGKQLSWPNPQDSPEVNNLKSRIRLRHETFNGKMACYSAMSQTWRHSEEQHNLAFRAVAVTIQYALNDGEAVLFEA